MNLAHAERRPAFLLPLVIAALLAVALGLAIASFVVTLSDDEGGTTIVREVSVTPAAEAPAHFAERPDESAAAAAVAAAAKPPSLSEQMAQQRYGTAQYRVDPSTAQRNLAEQEARSQYGASQYRVDPSTGQATPVPEIYGWHDKP
jgi:hypothetical protein